MPETTFFERGGRYGAFQACKGLSFGVVCFVAGVAAVLSFLGSRGLIRVLILFERNPEIRLFTTIIHDLDKPIR